MPTMRMKRILVAVALLLLPACHAKAPRKDAPRSCRSNSDCAVGWACLAGSCAVDPGTAATPIDVKNQIEQINAAHEDKVDKLTAGAQ